MYFRLTNGKRMTKVISFISRKGGTGKTTNAINLATMLHSLGNKVLLVETDTNYTLNTLRKMELFKMGAKDAQLFPIHASDDEKIAEEIAALKNQSYDYILLDTAGKTTDSNIKKICVSSDLVIIPTSLSQNDLLVTFQTVEDLKPARELNKSLTIAILPNRIHGSTKTKTISATLNELDATILDNFVPSKNLFTQSSTILPEKEYLAITKEILSLI
jgi:chromosome partitioning protein